MDLSIVIPALNEAAKIVADLESAAEFLVSEGLTGEVIVVDDGSTDGTAEAAEGVRLPDSVSRQVITSPTNHGKGHAVRAGIMRSQGDYAMFADSGLLVPFGYARRGIKAIGEGSCELAHGSRRMFESVIAEYQPTNRRVLSKLFREIVPKIMGLPRQITDSQCGFKVYRGDIARVLYAEARTDGFIFDIEIILLAVHHGYRIEEFAVEWSCDLDSRLHPARQLMPVLLQLAAIKWRMMRIKRG